MLRGLIATGLSVAALSCASDSQFQCAEDAQCGADGFCEVDGNCSFADDTCASGRRYGDHGSQGLAGTCVQPAATGTGDGATGPSPTTSPGTTTSPTTTDIPVGDTGDTSTGTSTTDGPVTSDGDSSTGAPPTMAFEDDFERPDAEEIGNGWWEKTPEAFALAGGQVVKSDTVPSYPDSLVLRPEQELLGDLEATLTFVVQDVSPLGFPQLHVRVQPQDAATPGSVTGYILYSVNTDTLQLTRQEAAAFAYQEATSYTDPPQIGETYRLRLRVEGEDPVVLDGYLEVLGDNGWTVHTEVQMVDADPTRISTPGRVGFSADGPEQSYVYEDFAYTALDG